MESQSNFSPLVSASMVGHPEAVKVLIDLGADIEYQDAVSLHHRSHAGLDDEARPLYSAGKAAFPLWQARRHAFPSMQ